MRFRLFHKSLRHALAGIRYVFHHERNFQIHTVAAVVAFAAGLVLGLARWEMIVLLFVITAVLVLELINSAVEHFADMLKPRMNQHIGLIKDMMAAMVLVAAIGALCVGVLLFVPHIIELLSIQ